MSHSGAIALLILVYIGSTPYYNSIVIGSQLYFAHLLGFVAKLACLVLWVSKPAFLSDHQLTGVSCTFPFNYDPLVGLPI